MVEIFNRNGKHMNTFTNTLNKEFIKKLTLPKTATYLVIIGLFFLMLSTSIMDKLFITSVVLMLLNANFRLHFFDHLKQPVVLSALPLILLFSAGLIYTQGFTHDAFHMWNKYLKILYPLFLIPLFFDTKYRQYALKAFVVGVVIAEVLTYLRHFELITLGLPPIYHWFVHDIDGSFIVAFCCYTLMNFISDEKAYRWWYLAALTFILIDLFFLNQERTGYLVFIALSGLFFLQRFGRKGFLIGLLVIPLTMGGLYLGSKTFHDRTNMIFSDIHGYSKGNNSTSIGLRLAFAEYSFQMIKHSPIFGSGTGSFKKLYQQLQGPKLGGNTWPGHPHNEYIFILQQIGILGFIFFLIWIYLQIRESFFLPPVEKRLLQGLICGFLLLSFCNSSLALSPGSNLYVVLLAVLIAANPKYRQTSFEINNEPRT